MTKATSGGGITSNKLVRSKAPKMEPRSHAIDPGAVSRLGAHPSPAQAKPLVSGRGYSTPVGPSSNMGQGPGANRTVYRSGSQSATPAAKPMPTGSFDILREFGPDVPGRK